MTDDDDVLRVPGKATRIDGTTSREHPAGEVTGKRTLLDTASGGRANAVTKPGTTPRPQERSAPGGAAADNEWMRERLPYLDRIRKAFGRHDVSQVTAQVGSQAADLGAEFGARAFASGDHVGFADAPDLHTAAHEAAHVVQQRAGVSLPGGIDQPGDVYERNADEVADAVVRGDFAEPLLDRMIGGSAAAPADPVVQRKAAALPATAAPPARQLAPGQHYKVAGEYAYLLDVAWYSADAVEDGGRLISVSKTIEILSYLRGAGMFAWATPETLAEVAKTIGIPAHLKAPEITMRIGANVLAAIGLPPNSSAMVSRDGDGLRVAVRLETGEAAPASSIVVKGSTVEAVYRALETFTGMSIPKAARVESFPMQVGNGAVHRSVSSATLEELFGKQPWAAWKQEHDAGKAGATAGQNAVGAQSVAAELTEAERLRLTTWLSENVGSPPSNGNPTAPTRELLAMIDDIEQGSLKRYRDGIVAHLRAHRTANGSAITPTTLRQAVDAAMRHSLGAERDGENSAPKVDPLLDDALPATMSYSGGLALDGDTVTFVVAFDWAALHKSKSGKFDETQTADDFAKREWHAEVEWVFDRIDQPRPGAEVGMAALVSDVVRTRHDSSDIRVAHQLSLDRSESEGTWLVHAFVRTSHMPLIRVSTQIQVKSEGKRMQELRSQALGGMAHPDLLERDEDRFSGPLAFAPRSDTERAATRELDVERLENVRDYLRQHADGRNADAIAAIEQQIERRREQDKKIKGDAGDGWRTFDVRATYLSKVDEVPSGALDIYGAFKVEEVASGVRLPTVMLRDLSRRFEQTEYTFKGHGATFEDALKDATTQLSKDYPKGRLALFAEEQDPTGQRSTGKTIGFERETYSTWKAVKEKVFHPLAQIAVAAASAAVMIFVPPAAAIIPLFVETVYSSVQTADDLIHRSQNGTLDSSMMAIDIGTIGLSVLPFVSAAKSVRGSARAMFALEIANLGGQALLMAGNVKETLATMQAQDVAAIAQMYGELVEAEKTYQPSDPRLVERRAAIEARADGVRGRLRDAFSQVAGQQMLFMIPGHVFKAIQAGRGKLDHEPEWVPGDRGTPVEETDWADLDRELSGGEVTPGATPASRPRAAVPSEPKAPVGAHDTSDTPNTDPADTTTNLRPALGAEIAALVPGVRYEAGGMFTVTIGDREITARIRRTSGRPRVVHEGESVILEVPRGFDQAQLRVTVAGQLAEIRSAPAQVRGTPAAVRPSSVGARVVDGGAAGTVAEADASGARTPSTGEEPSAGRARTRPPEATQDASATADATRNGSKVKGASQLVDDLGAGKALPEQHAHEQGSVPIDAVLGMIEERPDLTPEQRSKQIDLLEELIGKATGKGKNAKDAKVSDLSPSAVDVKDGTVRAPRKIVIASVSGSLEVGLLNDMVNSKRAIVDAAREGNTAGRQKAEESLTEALRAYRKAITMQKPGDARYDASINTGAEFFGRYQMILGHGMKAAEVAKGRASADQLGMQELRYSPKEKGLAAMREDAAHLLANRPDDADVSLTYATTKNRTFDENPHANEQAQVVDFVRDWYVDPKSQRMFNGFENAGVEHADKPPMTMWQGAAERTFRNAMVMREHLASQLQQPGSSHALAERLARVTGKPITEAEAVLAGFQIAPYETALVATEHRASELRAKDDALRARRKTDPAEPWHPALPDMDPATGQLVERFAGLNLEEIAAQTRSVTEALNIWSAETGVHHGEVTTLGMTMHAGEQLLNRDVKPFDLLEQVDQAVSMGTDRIGHALILGIDPDVLVQKDRLEPGERAAFAQRQREVRDRARARGVVIETNMSSNIEISNLTDNQHPAGRFVEQDMRVTVNTDDETVLGTDMAKELHRVSEARGVTRSDLATMILEGYRSRLGNRELAHRERIKPVLKAALLRGVTGAEATAMADHLARYFHVEPAASPTATVSRILDVTLGM